MPTTTLSRAQLLEDALQKSQTARDALDQANRIAATNEKMYEKLLAAMTKARTANLASSNPVIAAFVQALNNGNLNNLALTVANDQNGAPSVPVFVETETEAEAEVDAVADAEAEVETEAAAEVEALMESESMMWE